MFKKIFISILSLNSLMVVILMLANTGLISHKIFYSFEGFAHILYSLIPILFVALVLFFLYFFIKKLQTKDKEKKFHYSKNDNYIFLSIVFVIILYYVLVIFYQPCGFTGCAWSDNNGGGSLNAEQIPGPSF